MIGPNDTCCDRFQRLNSIFIVFNSTFVVQRQVERVSESFESSEAGHFCA